MQSHVGDNLHTHAHTAHAGTTTSKQQPASSPGAATAKVASLSPVTSWCPNSTGSQPSPALQQEPGGDLVTLSSGCPKPKLLAAFAVLWQHLQEREALAESREGITESRGGLG